MAAQEEQSVSAAWCTSDVTGAPIWSGSTLTVTVLQVLPTVYPPDGWPKYRAYVRPAKASAVTSAALPVP